MCDAAEQEKCRQEFGDNLEWSCEHCAKRRADDIHPYTMKLMAIYTLQRAGYPLEAGDLEYAEWLDLGRLRQVMEAMQTAARGCPLMGGRGSGVSDATG